MVPLPVPFLWASFGFHAYPVQPFDSLVTSERDKDPVAAYETRRDRKKGKRKNRDTWIAKRCKRNDARNRSM
jgi:hypothetical protein